MERLIENTAAPGAAEAAIEELTDLCYGLARRLGIDVDRVVSDLFEQVFEQLSRDQCKLVELHGEDLARYVQRMAKCRVFDRARRRARRREQGLEEADGLPGHEAAPDDLLAERELADALRSIERPPQVAKDDWAIWSATMDGLTRAQIATARQSSVRTISRALARVRAVLRDLMGDEDGWTPTFE